MSRVERISPSFGRPRVPPSESNRQLRRPNFSSLSNVITDSESNPTSTKNQLNKDSSTLLRHQRQTSTIFSGLAINTPIVSVMQGKKTLPIRKPQIQISTKIFDITKFTQLVSSKSIDKNPLMSNSQLRPNKSTINREKDIGKENILPNRMTHNPIKQDSNPIKKITGSYSHHEIEVQDTQVNAQVDIEIQREQKYYISNVGGLKEREKPTKVHNRTLSQEQHLIKKDAPRIPKSINIELDMLCQEIPRGWTPQQQPSSIKFDTHSTGFDEETIYHLYKREQVYQVTSNYDRLQPQINSIMRAVLVDWLTEVCKEFTLKRETLHLAVHNFDLFMARRDNVPRGELQLVGVSCLYIACKLEEVFPPKVSDFSQASNYGFSNQQILEKEIEICGVLKWLLNPPTLYLWTTWYMSQWDLFWQQNQSKLKFAKEKIFSFKQSNQQSYTIFRQFMNLLDCSILDLKTFKYSNREIVASLIYLLMLRQYLGISLPKVKEILQSKAINREVSQFQQFFVEYCQLCFGFSFQNIQNCLKYFLNFLTLEMIIDQPGSSKITQEKEMEDHYEYFLSIQTHSSNNLVFVRQRLNKSAA